MYRESEFNSNKGEKAASSQRLLNFKHFQPYQVKPDQRDKNRSRTGMGEKSGIIKCHQGYLVSGLSHEGYNEREVDDGGPWVESLPVDTVTNLTYLSKFY